MGPFRVTERSLQWGMNNLRDNFTVSQPMVWATYRRDPQLVEYFGVERRWHPPHNFTSNYNYIGLAKTLYKSTT